MAFFFAVGQAPSQNPRGIRWEAKSDPVYIQIGLATHKNALSISRQTAENQSR